MFPRFSITFLCLNGCSPIVLIRHSRYRIALWWEAVPLRREHEQVVHRKFLSLVLLKRFLLNVFVDNLTFIEFATVFSCIAEIVKAFQVVVWIRPLLTVFVSVLLQEQLWFFLFYLFIQNNAIWRHEQLTRICDPLSSLLDIWVQSVWIVRRWLPLRFETIFFLVVDYAWNCITTRRRNTFCLILKEFCCFFGDHTLVKA